MSARIMALADVYDALISKRAYKPAFPHSQAVEMIMEGKNSHFDPVVVDAFMEISDEFFAVSERFRDSIETGRKHEN